MQFSTYAEVFHNKAGDTYFNLDYPRVILWVRPKNNYNHKIYQNIFQYKYTYFSKNYINIRIKKKNIFK